MPPWDGRERRRLPLDYFYDRLNSLEEKMDGQHLRVRADLSTRFDQLSRKMDEHSKDDDEVEGRVLIMETERKVEGQQMARRSGWIALLVSAGISLFGKWALGKV